MEENNNKNTRVFYVTMAIVLAIVTILIVATVAARKSIPEPSIKDSNNLTTNENTDRPTIDEEDTNTIPTFVLPVVGELSVDFSDSVPVFSQTMNDYRTHLGVDIKASLGSDVIAVADGTVTNVWDDPFMGTCVSIEHSGNALSIYKNLDPTVKDGIIGASVKSGDIIGAVGESAMNEIAEEPHLHYELKVDNKHVDPKSFFKFMKPNETPSEDKENTENKQ